MEKISEIVEGKDWKLIERMKIEIRIQEKEMKGKKN